MTKVVNRRVQRKAFDAAVHSPGVSRGLPFAIGNAPSTEAVYRERLLYTDKHFPLIGQFARNPKPHRIVLEVMEGFGAHFRQKNFSSGCRVVNCRQTTNHVRLQQVLIASPRRNLNSSLADSPLLRHLSVRRIAESGFFRLNRPQLNGQLVCIPNIVAAQESDVAPTRNSSRMVSRRRCPRWASWAQGQVRYSGISRRVSFYNFGGAVPRLIFDDQQLPVGVVLRNARLNFGRYFADA